MENAADFGSILAHWREQLSDLYDGREVAAMFRIVLEDLLELGKQQQLSEWNAVQDVKVRDLLSGVLGRLLTGEPLQHVTGFTYFDDLKIAVSPAVLIPRPETEELVYEVVNRLPAGFSGTILDWCTGSGCIALALKKHFPMATVKAFDLSEEALEVARKNARDLSLEVIIERRDALAAESPQADVIVSNPPYIPDSELAAMHSNVTDFEPAMALFVPDDQPQLFYDALIRKAVTSLPSGGMLFFELHEDHAGGTRELAEQTGQFSEVMIVKDMQEKQRMLVARKA